MGRFFETNSLLQRHPGGATLAWSPRNEVVLSGTGRLYHRTLFLLEVEYQLLEAADLSRAGVAGLRGLAGRLVGDPAELRDAVGCDLTLHLDDGRRWDCFLANRFGRVVGCGPIYLATVPAPRPERDFLRP